MARTLNVKIIGDSSSLERAFKRSASASEGLGRSLTVLAKTGAALFAIDRAVRGLETAFTGTVGAAVQFENSMQQTVGLSGIAQDKIAGLTGQVLKLAPAVGKSPQELAKALFFITSSGIDAAHAMGVLTASAKASAAGLGDTQAVADAVTSALNAYGVANLSAQHATDVLVSTVREGKGEADQFAGVIGNVAAIAAQLGVSFNEVGAALAAQTRLGTDAETSATQLQRVFGAFVKVTPQAAKAFKSVGLNADQLRADLGDKGLLFVLNKVKDAFGNNLPAEAKAFGDIRALRGVLSLVGKQADATAGIFKRMTDTTGSLSTAFEAVSGDTAFRFRQMKAAAEVAGISLGALFEPLASAAAKVLTRVTEQFTGFVEKVNSAKGGRAKFKVVFDGLKDIGREALDAIQGVDFKGIAARIGARIRDAVKNINVADVGREVGLSVSRALASVSDFIGRVNWQAVGKAIILGIGAAVELVLTALPGILDGIGRLAVRLLQSIGQLLLGAGKELGSALLHGIEAGFAKVGRQLERLALNIVLKIIEPFTHLPGFLGGGPFRDMKDAFQHQLDGMESAASKTASHIAAVFGTDVTKPAGSTNRAAAFAGSGSDVARKQKAAAAAATTQASTVATDTVEKGFNLPFRLRLAEAQAAATKAVADDLRVARDIRSFVLKAIPHLHGEKLIGAYQALASANDTLAQAAKDAAEKAKEAADKAKQFAVPLGLQLTQARLEALGKPVVSVLKKIRASAEAALKSGRLGLQGQLDAWNAIKDVNDQLKNAGSDFHTKFVKVNPNKILDGLNLAADARRAILDRLSQVGANGKVPGSGPPGAFGHLPTSGGDTVIPITFQLDGRTVATNTTRHQIRARRRNPKQRRGFAGSR